MTPEKRRHIGKILKHNHSTTAGEPKAKLEGNDPELEVSERTIRRELENLGYISVLPRKVPLLTQQAKDVRLSLARKHLRYNWRKVVFRTKQQFRCLIIPFVHGLMIQNLSSLW